MKNLGSLFLPIRVKSKGYNDTINNYILEVNIMMRFIKGVMTTIMIAVLVAFVGLTAINYKMNYESARESWSNYSITGFNFSEGITYGYSGPSFGELLGQSLADTSYEVIEIISEVIG